MLLFPAQNNYMRLVSWNSAREICRLSLIEKNQVSIVCSSVYFNFEAASMTSDMERDVSEARLDEFENYDVFISHRGPNVKTGFVSCLYEALKRAGLHPFLDCESIGKGQDSWKCIDHAIQTTPLALVIFSENFAQPEWCLRELHAMLDSPSMKVLPIFYHVQPWEVNFPEKGQLATGFAKLIERHETIVLEEWRADLKRASKLNGWEHKVGDKR